MKRIGSLVVFKADVSRARAEKALAALRGLVEDKFLYPNGFGKPAVRSDDPVEHIEEFDDSIGGPVWYIP